MQNTAQENETPFECVARNVEKLSSIEIMELLQKFHSLSQSEAKCILLSSPEFQEQFCRMQIQNRERRGGKKYGSRNFLRKRFKLTEDEADRLIDDFWESRDDEISDVFLEIISIRRVARCQLTDWAQDVVEKVLHDSQP